MEAGEDSAHVVGVSPCDSAPLLWRVEDLRSVRSQGLVGALLGSLPRTPRQNVRMGRPLLLLPEEERLLSERHAAAALPAGYQVSPPAGRQVSLGLLFHSLTNSSALTELLSAGWSRGGAAGEAT